jgi:hypothetical protein
MNAAAVRAGSPGHERGGRQQPGGPAQAVPGRGAARDPAVGVAGGAGNVVLGTGTFALEGTWSNAFNGNQGGCVISRPLVTVRIAIVVCLLWQIPGRSCRSSSG